MKVDLDVLRKLPDQMDRLVDDAVESKTYLTDGVNESLGGAEPGLINLFAGEHMEARQKVEDFLDELATATAPGFSSATAAAISHYESTDEDSAADIDDSITVDPDDLGDVNDSLSTLYRDPDLPDNLFDDREEPTDALKKVKDYNGDGFGGTPEWLDLLSPTAWIVDTVYGVTSVAADLGILDRAYNMRDEFVKPFTGDWAGVRACADYYEHVADSLTSMAANLTWATYSASSCWEANASDACQISLTDLKNTLISASSTLGPLSAEYTQAAVEINGERAILTGLLTELTDAAIIAAGAAALAAATAKTAIGGILFGGVAAYELYMVAEIVQEVLTLVSRCNTYAVGVADFFSGFGVIESGDPMPELPATPSVPGE